MHQRPYRPSHCWTTRPSAALLPLVIVLGLAAKATVGAGGVTDTVVDCVALPPGPRTGERIGRVGPRERAGGLRTAHGLSSPSKRRRRRRRSHWSMTSVNVEVAPLATVLGLALKLTVAVGVGVTVTVTD